MKPDARFSGQPKQFWACVRSISQELGYTIRGRKTIKVHTIPEMKVGLARIGLDPCAMSDETGRPTELAERLHEYFRFRALVLESVAKKKLMTVKQATALYKKCARDFPTTRPAPMNKQKGQKKAPAFLTALVNMMIEYHARGAACDYDPRKLTTITRNGLPLRTLARRVDGAFPGAVNPIAVWEIKEYYYTTTFGSRVADGVYETLLDGLELEELRDNERVDIKHYLMVDDYNTWWNMGRSYLCRIVDMLHMGYVDEVLFGREVVEEMPRIVAEWIRLSKQRGRRGSADPPAEL